jgi:hypothetical protein
MITLSFIGGYLSLLDVLLVWLLMVNQIYMNVVSSSTTPTRMFHGIFISIRIIQILFCLLVIIGTMIFVNDFTVRILLIIPFHCIYLSIIGLGSCYLIYISKKIKTLNHNKEWNHHHHHTNNNTSITNISTSGTTNNDAIEDIKVHYLTILKRIRLVIVGIKISTLLMIKFLLIAVLDQFTVGGSSIQYSEGGWNRLAYFFTNAGMVSNVCQVLLVCGFVYRLIDIV